MISNMIKHGLSIVISIMIKRKQTAKSAKYYDLQSSSVLTNVGQPRNVYVTIYILYNLHKYTIESLKIPITIKPSFVTINL